MRGATTGDNVTVTIRFEDGSVANLVYLANGDRAVAQGIFRGILRRQYRALDDFKTLSLSRNGKTETIEGRTRQRPSQGNGADRRSHEAGKGGPYSFCRIDRSDRGHLRHRGGDQDAEDGVDGWMRQVGEKIRDLIPTEER